MCERRSDSTTRPAYRAHSLSDTLTDSQAEPPAAPLSEPGGRFDNSFAYRVTEEGLRALAEYEERHVKTVVRQTRLPNTVAEALEDEAWRDRQRQRRKDARDRGKRLVSVCGRWRNGQKVPDLRLMGLWLERAGFDLGRHCEVEVTPGTLTIRAV